jgi:hypothetical protein
MPDKFEIVVYSTSETVRDARPFASENNASGAMKRQTGNEPGTVYYSALSARYVRIVALADGNLNLSEIRAIGLKPPG